MSHDTICRLIPLQRDTAIIYACTPDSLIKDSCVIFVRDQFLALETDTTNINGIIELSLIIPDNSFVAGCFELQLPYAFGLAWEGNVYRATLSDDFKSNFDLRIKRANDSIYSFDITPRVKAASSGIKLRSGASLLKLMDIPYSIYKDNDVTLNEKYTARLVDVVIELSDTLFMEDRIDIMIKPYWDPTGNAVIVNPARLSYLHNKRLYVDSDKAETIQVYTLNGSHLFTGKKKEGQAVFNLNTSETIVVVRGSSGWANKVANQ